MQEDGTAKALLKIFKVGPLKSQENAKAMKDIRNYLVLEDPQVMINQLDKRITYKKREDKLAYERNLNEDSILQCLDSKPGKLFNPPCMTMMRAYKFLSKAFNTQNHCLMDFSDPEYNLDCDHTYAQD